MFDKVNGERTFADEFLAASGFQDLASLRNIDESQMLLIHLKEEIMRATQQRVHIQVSSFDFSYLGRLTSALPILCKVFKQQHFKDILKLITDPTCRNCKSYPEVNDLVMHLIDELPVEDGLQQGLLSVLAECGLPKHSGVMEFANETQVVGEYLFQTYHIVQQYYLVHKWRMCRLQLAYYCQHVLQLMVPMLRQEAFERLSPEQKELAHFLDMAYRALRPIQPFFKFEHDQKVIMDVLGSGMGYSSRLLLFIQQLISTSSSSTRNEGEWHEPLLKLVDLFIFVARGCTDNPFENVLGEHVWNTVPAQEKLVSIVTLTEKTWTPMSSMSAEVFRVLGGSHNVMTALPGGHVFPVLPHLFAASVPHFLRPKGELPRGWQNLIWYSGPRTAKPQRRSRSPSRIPTSPSALHRKSKLQRTFELDHAAPHDACKLRLVEPMSLESSFPFQVPLPSSSSGTFSSSSPSSSSFSNTDQLPSFPLSYLDRSSHSSSSSFPAFFPSAASAFFNAPQNLNPEDHHLTEYLNPDL